MNRKSIIFLFITLSILIQGNIFADKIKITFYTTDRLSPHVILEDNKMSGIIGDFINNSLGDIAIVQIKNLPWPRAQNEMQREKNSMIAPLGRNKERELKYKWLTKVFDDPVCVCLQLNQIKV